MQPSSLSAQLYVTNKPSFWVLQFLHRSAQTTTQLSVHVLGCLSFFKIPWCPQSGWVPGAKQGRSSKLKLKTPNTEINKMGCISNNKILSEMNCKHILFMVGKILLNIFLFILWQFYVCISVSWLYPSSFLFSQTLPNTPLPPAFMSAPAGILLRW